MLWHHLFAFPEKLPEGVYISVFPMWEKDFAHYLGYYGKVCVSIFVFLSGYGLFFKKEPNYIIKKIKSTYISYWKVFIIFVPISILLGYGSREATSILSAFLCVSSNYCIFNGTWWFLRMYIFFLLLFPIIKTISSKIKHLYIDLTVTTFLYFTIFKTLQFIQQYNEWNMFKQMIHWDIFDDVIIYLPTFILGYIFAKYDLLSKIKRTQKQYVILSILFILFSFYIRCTQEPIFDYFLTPIIICSLSILICFSNKIMNKILGFLGGKYSMNIFLIHYFFSTVWIDKTSTFIYSLKYPVLIFISLLAISVISSVLVDKIYLFINYLWKK